MEAIYSRQSIDKKDSISIDTQVQHCRLLCSTEPVIYKDAGYSGSNTERPEFQKMIADIQAGKIHKVVAYRLDRISRSLTDFAKLIELFQKYNVSFHSASEQFDTSSPMGRAMVYIIMVFAQLERETIVARIKDNYFARAKKGMFTGGACPLGYKSVKVDIDGKATAVLDIDPEYSQTVKDIFHRYVYERKTLLGIRKTLPGIWTITKVRRILKNPTYAANTPDLYQYFKNKGYQVINEIDDFDGRNGCMLIGKEVGRKNRRMTDISEQSLIIGLHEPLIDANTYIQAQKILEKNYVTKRAGTSEYTWLTGLTKCGECGYTITVKTSRHGEVLYKFLICRGRSDRGSHVCDNLKLPKIATLEADIEKYLFNYVDALSKLGIPQNEPTLETNKIKAEIIKLDEKINNLLDQMSEGVVGNYVMKKIEELDAQKKKLQEKLTPSTSNSEIERLMTIINEFKERWNDGTVRDKHLLASEFISRIDIFKNHQVKIQTRF